ncbi:MAG: hypothetical protein FWF10_11350 [Clostridiales bacterium]|nr:hypothetical protein [Clostridiales bacterium]
MTLIFDQCHTLCDVQDETVKDVYETVETLDRWLTEAGIPHAFSLPHDTDETPDGRFPVLNLMNLADDNFEVALIYTRYLTKIRDFPINKAADFLMKFMAKYVCEEVEV